MDELLPERDETKTNSQQGLFRKFDVRRTDNSDAPGGKHDGCEYFVLDITHDKYAKTALAAYALSCEKTHPDLAADLVCRYGLHQSSVETVLYNAAYEIDDVYLHGDLALAFKALHRAIDVIRTQFPHVLLEAYLNGGE